jgi:hypothetical protein
MGKSEAKSHLVEEAAQLRSGTKIDPQAEAATLISRGELGEMIHWISVKHLGHPSGYASQL